MIDVEVRDFQSIERASIRVSGFTALVGKSNIGKSALVRAVKAALTGASGTSFVRHGRSCARRIKKAKTCECYCSVHLTAEGFDLTWEKGDKKNRYLFNGKEYEVPNRGTPEFLEKPRIERDFGTVKVGDQWKILQVADQFDNVFLLNQTGGAVADVFSDVARLDRINVAMRMVEKDRRDSVSTRKVRQEDVLRLGRQLETYQGLDSATAKVPVIETQFEKVTNTQDAVSALGGYIEEIRALGYRVDQLQKACAVDLPEINPVLSSRGRLELIRSLFVNATERAQEIKRLMGIGQVADPQVDGLMATSAKYRQIEDWNRRVETFQGYAKQLKGVESLPVIDASCLKEASERTTTLYSLSRKYETLNRGIVELEEGLSRALVEENAIETERSQIDGLCPTCAQPLLATHVHQERLVS